MKLEEALKINSVMNCLIGNRAAYAYNTNTKFYALLVTDKASRRDGEIIFFDKRTYRGIVLSREEEKEAFEREDWIPDVDYM